MPLDMLFPGNPEIVSTLKANHIHTIEHLAEMKDGNKFAFALPLQQKAQKFLESRKADAMPQMEHQMQALMDRVRELEAEAAAKPKRGPGRPPKAQETINELR